MSTAAWVAVQLANIGLQIWIIWGGGAQRLSGTIWTILIHHPAAASWGADGVKVFAWLALLGGTFWLAVGLIDPDIRWLWPL